MAYRVVISPAALREIKKLPEHIKKAIAKEIPKLADTPRPSGVTKLAGGAGYRIRTRDYRIIYTIADNELIVMVVKVGHRKYVYRNI